MWSRLQLPSHTSVTGRADHSFRGWKRIRQPLNHFVGGESVESCEVCVAKSMVVEDGRMRDGAADARRGWRCRCMEGMRSHSKAVQVVLADEGAEMATVGCGEDGLRAICRKVDVYSCLLETSH